MGGEKGTPVRETPLLRGFSKTGRKETGAEAGAEENARRIQGDGFPVPVRVPSSEILRAQWGGEDIQPLRWE